jgi:lipopolysaccharide export system permease protein
MILDRYLVRLFMPIFAVSAGMFMFVLLLIDLFLNLVRYLNFEVPFVQIMRISMFYLPKSFSYALPMSLLFASAYTLGELYTRNELISVFSSGIPFRRFSLPLVIIGFIASFFSFFFDDIVVIPTLRVKNELSRHFLRQTSPDSGSDIVIKARGGELIYSIDYYDYTMQVLNGINIIELDSRGQFVSQIRAPRARWTGEYWDFVNPFIYYWEGGWVRAGNLPPTDAYREAPDIFRRSAVRHEELSARQGKLLVQDLKDAGLPYMTVEADYYHRYSYATISFIVMVLSITMGGRFRKNILLMSLLASLGAAVLFYVTEMISMMMARMGYIPTLVGAWFPVVIFVIIGAVLLGWAKT